MGETIISSTPVSKTPKTLGGSIGGIFVGILLIPVALWICYYGETRKEVSAYVQRAVAIQPNNPPANDTDVRFSGTPQAEVVSDVAYGVANAWYINRKVEEYKQVEKTRRVKKDGKDYEEKYLTNEWVQNPNESQTFATGAFKFGPLAVTPATGTEWLEPSSNNMLMPQTILGRPTGAAPNLGDKRVTITGIRAGSPLFVAGHFANGTITPNEDGMMVISALTEQETIKSLKSGDRMIYWVIKAVAFFLLYGAFMMILGPVTWALSWIPLIGNLGKGIIGFCMFVLSFVIIFSMSALIHFFWWVVGGFVVILILIVIAAKVMMKKKAAVA